MFRSPGLPLPGLPVPLAVLPLPVTRPNDPLVGLVTWLSRFSRLGKWNTSARNWTRVPVGAPNVLNNAMSHAWVDGPRTGFRPALPKVPGAGLANACGLNQKT